MLDLKQIKQTVISLILAITSLSGVSGTPRDNKPEVVNEPKSIVETQKELTKEIKIENKKIEIVDDFRQEPKVYGTLMTENGDIKVIDSNYINSIAKNEKISGFFYEDEIIKLTMTILNQMPELYENEFAVANIIEAIAVDMENNNTPDIYEEENFKKILSVVRSIVKDMKNEQKLEFVLEEYGITYDQFITIGAICIAEGGFSYDELYNVASTMLNRINSKQWVDYVNASRGNGRNIYSQAVTTGQFVAYEEGYYKKHLNYTMDTYQPVLDCLYSGEASHDFLSFKAYEGPGYVQFVKGGNWYHQQFSYQDRIEEEPSKQLVLSN